MNPTIIVVAPMEQDEELLWTISDLGPLAIEQRDATTMIPSEKPGTVEFRAGFATTPERDRAFEELKQTVQGDVAITVADVEDDGWSQKWREFFKPVVLTKIQVVTGWMTPPRPELIPIVIDPGQAFGTGGHATTRLILRMLEQYADAGLPDRVLDVGTGSGVLAVAAVKLGAKKVTAIDIEEESILSTRENAEKNHVAQGVEAILGTADTLEGTWPLVLANIQLSVFENHAESIAAKIAPGGTALLSGLLVEQIDPCMALWPGFQLISKLEEDEWAALAIRPAP